MIRRNGRIVSVSGAAHWAQRDRPKQTAPDANCTMDPVHGRPGCRQAVICDWETVRQQNVRALMLGEEPDLAGEFTYTSAMRGASVRRRDDHVGPRPPRKQHQPGPGIAWCTKGLARQLGIDLFALRARANVRGVGDAVSLRSVAGGSVMLALRRCRADPHLLLRRARSGEMGGPRRAVRQTQWMVERLLEESDGRVRALWGAVPGAVQQRQEAA